MRCSWYLGSLAVAVVVLGAGSAHAAPCGQPPAGSIEPAVGDLALDTQGSDDPALPSFEGGTNERDVVFVFKVTGCRLSQDSDVAVRAAGDEGDALTLTAEPKGELLVVTGRVDPGAFAPGEHKPKLLISSPSGQVRAQSLALTLQRKQPPALPLVLAAIAFALGLAYAFAVARQVAIDAYDQAKAAGAGAPAPKTRGLFARLIAPKRNLPAAPGQEPKVRYGPVSAWLGVAIGAGGAAGAAFVASYVKSATWALGVVTVITLMVAVGAAAAGGAAGGLVKAITARDAPKDRDDDPEPPAPRPDEAARRA